MVDDLTTASVGDDAPSRPGAVRTGTIIVFGNEKGGTGKSTIAMHMAVAFANAGGRVGIIDLDSYNFV